MRVLAPVLCLLCALSLCLSGCRRDVDGGYYGTTKPKHPPDELWYNLSAEPEWIDPGKATDSSAGVVVLNTFAGLTQPHPVTLQPMPDIAKGWEILDDGRRYIFHLRRTTWSDGAPLTAHDFEFAWKRVLDPRTASRYAMFLYPLLYAEQVHGRALQVSGATIPDAAAVREAAAAHGKVGSVVEAPELKSVFVHVKAQDEGGVREAMIAALDGKTLGGQKVRARVAGGDAIGVHALDDYRLEVRLGNPVPYFLNLLSFYTTMPVPRHLLARLREQGIQQELWTRPEYIVSNGPFTLAQWRFRQFMVLERNARYWDAEHVRLRRVRMSIVESANTSLNLYEAGELDHTGQTALPAEFLSYLEKAKDFRREPFLGTYFLWLNTKVKPLDDLRVRRALSLAVDREKLIKYIVRGGQVPTADLVPDGVAGYRGLGTKLYDPVRARKLIEEAGYGPDHPLPPITYSYNTSEGHRKIAQALQQMWKETLGVTIELENQEWKVYLKNLEAKDFVISRMGWIGDYADPNTFLELLLEGNGNNHSNWSSPKYAELLKRGNATLDPARRLELLRQAERVARDAVPILPLYVYTNSDLVKPYVRGYWINYTHRTMFKYMWIDERFYKGTPEPLDNVSPPVLQPDPAPRLPAEDAPGDAGAADAGARQQTDAATTDAAAPTPAVGR